MNAIRKPYDQLGCQICTTGLPHLQMLPPFETFLHNFGSNWLSIVIFLAKPMFSWTRNQQLCQICTTWLPDLQILPNFNSFPHKFGSNGLKKGIFLLNPCFNRHVFPSVFIWFLVHENMGLARKITLLSQLEPKLRRKLSNGGKICKCGNPVVQIWQSCWSYSFLSAFIRFLVH